MCLVVMRGRDTARLVQAEIQFAREFFFSSRRRHTRCSRDWSSDVCSSDLVHLYEEYGEDCVHHLRGMFAFAIWDARHNRLFCARDRLGIKPFYYAIAGDRFAFASEIKALFELRDFKTRLNRSALPEFFAFGYLSAHETLYKNVYKLLPGHRLSLDLAVEHAKPQITQYWELDCSLPEHPLSEADYVSQFSDLFTETVRGHLMSD